MPENISLNHVVGVSWPRSGHHLLVRLLQRGIGPRFVYCRDYAQQNGMENVRGCCDIRICGNKDHVHFCKNHDNRGLVPKIPGIRYLVQYRGFWPATISTFEKVAGDKYEDTEKAFRMLASRRAPKYREFIQKWVSQQDDSIEKLLVRYEDLTADAEETLLRAFDFFGVPHGAIDSSRLRHVIETEDRHTNAGGLRHIEREQGVSKVRKIEEFRFYAPEWFSEFEQETGISGVA